MRLRARWVAELRFWPIASPAVRCQRQNRSVVESAGQAIVVSSKPLRRQAVPSCRALVLWWRAESVGEPDLGRQLPEGLVKRQRLPVELRGRLMTQQVVPLQPEWLAKCSLL